MENNYLVLKEMQNMIVFISLIFVIVKGYGFKKRGRFSFIASLVLAVSVYFVFSAFVFSNNSLEVLLTQLGICFLYIILFADYPVHNIMTTLISCVYTIIAAQGVLNMLLDLIPALRQNILYHNLLFIPFSILLNWMNCFFYSRYTFKTRFVLPLIYWVVMMLTPIIVYICLFVFLYVNPYQAQTTSNWTQMIFIILTFVLNGSIYYICYILNQSFNTLSEKEIIERSQALQLEHLERSATLVEQLRHDKHEMKNLFFYLQSVLELGEYDELRTFVEHNLTKRYERLEEFRTGNQFMDYLLTQKMNEARDYNIQMIADVSLPEKLTIDNADLCSLVMNVLDNAIDASKKESKGSISIQIYIEKSYLFISVCNKSSVDVLKANPQLKTSKPDPENHGIGMRIVRSIVTKYEGALRSYMQFDNYIVEIMLKIYDA